MHSKEKVRVDEEKTIPVRIEEDNIMLIISKKVYHPKNKKSKDGILDSSQRWNICKRGGAKIKKPRKPYLKGLGHLITKFIGLWMFNFNFFLWDQAHFVQFFFDYKNPGVQFWFFLELHSAKSIEHIIQNQVKLIQYRLGMLNSKAWITNLSN